MPLVVVHLDQRTVATQAGVVEDHVDPAMPFDCCIEQGPHVVLDCDIADACQGTCAAHLGQGVDGLGEAPLVDVGDHHRGTLLDASPGCGEPDACTGRGGYHDDPAVEQAVALGVLRRASLRWVGLRWIGVRWARRRHA